MGLVSTFPSPSSILKRKYENTLPSPSSILKRESERRIFLSPNHFLKQKSHLTKKN